MKLRVPITAEMDDGRMLHAVLDQRDYARLEAAGIGDEAFHTSSRFLAFSGLSRTKQYGGTWEQFNTNDCVEVTVEQEESADADESLDPGRSAPLAGN